MKNPAPISIEGPVEMSGSQLVILIPLDAGGDELASFAQGIGVIEDDCLKVVIQPWLAEKLRIKDGSLVVVDNLEGKFRIVRSTANDLVDGDDPASNVAG